MILKALSGLIGALAFTAMSLISAAGAQTNAPDDLSRVRGLSAEEKERILDRGTEAATDAAHRSFLGGGGASKQAHGELGMMVGTGGAVAIFGTGLVPLGENGAAIISFESSRSPEIRRRR
jgi:hypothetical protein